MTRSRQPPLWLLFGAGGMLSALLGFALVLVTGLAAPLAWGGVGDVMGYDAMRSFARTLTGAGFIFAVVGLFLWHAAHRIFHTLHDLGIRTGPLAWVACYGTALAGTLASAGALIALGSRAAG
jgi:fumarate reductase subunit D